MAIPLTHHVSQAISLRWVQLSVMNATGFVDVFLAAAKLLRKLRESTGDPGTLAKPKNGKGNCPSIDDGPFPCPWKSCTVSGIVHCYVWLWGIWSPQWNLGESHTLKKCLPFWQVILFVMKSQPERPSECLLCLLRCPSSSIHHTSPGILRYHKMMCLNRRFTSQALHVLPRIWVSVSLPTQTRQTTFGRWNPPEFHGISCRVYPTLRRGGQLVSKWPPTEVSCQSAVEK